MFDVMCDLLVMMWGAWQRGEVMWREEVMFRSLTERTEVNKKSYSEHPDKLHQND
jgi:hypothetical protein